LAGLPGGEIVAQLLDEGLLARNIGQPLERTE